MNTEKFIVEKTKQYVEQQLSNDPSGHDWWHTYRVWQNAINIGMTEGGNMFVVQLAALLHDIADYKLHNGDEDLGPRLAKEWLESLEVDQHTVAHVCDIIAAVSFKGANVRPGIQTKESMIVQDADRLDAIGAIGIARAFAYGGYKGRSIYDPSIKPKMHNTFEEYKTNTSPTINHFYEKLLLLKKLMNTESAMRIAQKRHEFMEKFLECFYLEWNGDDWFLENGISTNGKQ